KRLQIVQGVDASPQSVFGIAECVAEDFPGRRLRRNLRRYTARQRGFSEAIDDLLLGTLVVEAVLKLIAKVGQAKQRLAGRVLQSRHAGQSDFEWNRDLTFHLFR